MVFKKAKYCAFTLSEILITLSIIGIISVLTIPNLISKYESQVTYTALKKFQSVLANSYALITKEEGDFNAWGLRDGNTAHAKIIVDYINRNIRVIKTCEESAGCWSSTAPKALNKKVTALYSSNRGIGVNVVSAKLIDGTNICVDMWGTMGEVYNIFGVKTKIQPSATIWIDVNGDKGPNIVGRDIFAFVLKEQSVVPAGIDTDINCSIQNQTNTSGFSCTYNVFKEHGIKY